jgi:hypothetical protein
MTDHILTLLKKQAVELLAENVSGITEELRNNPEGKLSVSLGFKLNLAGNRVFVSTGVAYSRKFTDETEGMCELPDPNQPGLSLS